MVRAPKTMPSSFLASWAAGLYKDEAYHEQEQIILVPKAMPHLASWTVGLYKDEAYHEQEPMIPEGSIRAVHRAARLEAVTTKPLAQSSPPRTGAVPWGSSLHADGSRGGESVGPTCGSAIYALPRSPTLPHAVAGAAAFKIDGAERAAVEAATAKARETQREVQRRNAIGEDGHDGSKLSGRRSGARAAELARVSAGLARSAKKEVQERIADLSAEQLMELVAAEEAKSIAIETAAESAVSLWLLDAFVSNEAARVAEAGLAEETACVALTESLAEAAMADVIAEVAVTVIAEEAARRAALQAAEEEAVVAIMIKVAIGGMVSEVAVEATREMAKIRAAEKAAEEEAARVAAEKAAAEKAVAEEALVAELMELVIAAAMREVAVESVAAAERDRIAAEEAAAREAARLAAEKAAAEEAARLAAVAAKAAAEDAMVAELMESVVAAEVREVAAEAAYAADHGQWVLVFGGEDTQRGQLCQRLASQSGGSSMDLSSLLAFAKTDESEQARAAVALQKRGGLRGANDIAPLMLRFMEVHSAPYFCDSVFRMSNQLVEFEQFLRRLPLAIEAPGKASTAAVEAATSGMRAKLEARLHTAHDVDGVAVQAALEAVMAADVWCSPPLVEQ